MSLINYKQFFEGKRITKQGFGTLGRGFGVVKFLLECGAKVTVTDMKAEDNFTEQIMAIESLGYSDNVRYVFGRHEEADFVDCDFVIQASGVPKNNFFLNLSKQKNISVYQESSLFVKLVREFAKDVKIVGVTGTRGKTTTTFLLFELLKESLGEEKVLLGGNVQGVSTLENLKRVKDGDYVVMELDSWILQGFGDLHMSPDIAVFTTFMSDHMNYYKNDMREYFLDKANIFLNQKEGDHFFSTKEVESNIKSYLGEDYRQKYKLENEEHFVENQTMKTYPTHLLGEHNQVLLALVEKVSEELHIEKSFEKILKTFKGVKGRLEFVKEAEGVRIYNDTCATTPDATMAGLKALQNTLKPGNKIHLLCGGRDKELDLKKFVLFLVPTQKANILNVYLLKDESTTGTDKLLKEIREQGSELKYAFAENLIEGVSQIRANAKSGDVLFFSPAFASFGMFQNEYDRGEKFLDAIKNY
jgi:UDP-N-acetylmuramoylalanine--D-glutamate ligase